MTSQMINNEVLKDPQIVIKRKFTASRIKVWQAITEKEALSSWLMETEDFALRVGHQFQFATTPRGNFDGIIKCEMLAINEPSELSYTWKANEMKQPTIVKWTLQEVDNSTTILTLEHYGFVGLKGWLTKTMLGAGWKKLIRKKLSNYLGL